MKILYDNINPPAIIEYLSAAKPARIVWQATTQKTNEEILVDFLQENTRFIRERRKQIAKNYPSLLSA